MTTLFYTQYVGGKRTEVKHIINYIEELYNDKKDYEEDEEYTEIKNFKKSLGII